MVLDERPIELLVQAVRALAGQDLDHASQDNGVGYSKADTWFGASLATLDPYEWTPEVRREAWSMLKKYRGQLSQHGIDYDAIPEPAFAAPRTILSGSFRHEILEPLLPEYKERRERLEREKEERENRSLGENARRCFYDAGSYYGGEVFVLVLGKRRPGDLMEMVRSLPQRRWAESRADLGWEAPMTPGNARGILAILERFGWEITDELLPDGRFSVDPDVMEWLTKLAGDTTEPENPRFIGIKDDQIVIRWPKGDADFNDLLRAVKALPKRRYEPSESCWTVPLDDTISVANALAIGKQFRFGLDQALSSRVGEIERQAGDELERQRQAQIEKGTITERNLALQRAQDVEIDLPGFSGDLFPFQRAGVRYIVDNATPGKGVILGDDMGLGKTRQSICAMRLLDAYPVLVVTTASVKYQFENEWNQVLPLDRTTVVNGGSLEPGADVVLINYDVLQKNLERLQAYGFQGMIVDEIHRTKTRKAQRTKAVRELAKKIPYVVGLTGTVTMNRMAELEQPLAIINRLDDLGGWRHFIYDVCGAFHNGWGMEFPDPRKLSGVKRDEYLAGISAFNRQMRAEGAYIRRETDDVIDIPAMTNRVVPVEIDNRSEYDEARKNIIAYVGQLAESDKGFLRSIRHLSADEQKVLRRQRRESAEYKAELAEVLVKINKLKQLTARGKMQQAKDYVESFIEVGRKVVIMCWHKEVATELATTFHAPAIVGGVDGETKFRLQQEFNDNDDCMVIVCNIIAASEGLNLTAAADVIFVEQGWNPATMDQAARRIRRIGQTRPTTQHHLVGRKTIDEALVTLIRSKKLVTSAGNTGEVTLDEVVGGDLDYIIKSLGGDVELGEESA